MSSYLARVVRKHDTTARNFILTLKLWTVEGDHAQWSVNSLKRGESLYLNSYGAASSSFSDVLVLVTGLPELRRLNMAMFRPISARRGMSGFMTTRRWCSRCWEDDRKGGRVPYDRLLWFFRSTSRCHLHRSLLSEKCPACGLKQSRYSQEDDPTHCYYCGKSLSSEKALAASEPDRYESQVLGLVRRATSPLDMSIDSKAPYRFANALLTRLSTRTDHESRALARYVKGQHWFVTRTQPSLSSLLSLAHISGSDLASFLEFPEEAAAVARPLDGFDDTPRFSRPTTTTAAIIRSVEAAIRRELLTPPGMMPASIREIALSHKISTGQPTYWFPRLSEDLIRLRGARRDELLDRYRKVIDQELSPGVKSGEWRSINAASEQLADRHGLSALALRRYARELSPTGIGPRRNGS